MPLSFRNLFPQGDNESGKPLDLNHLDDSKVTQNSNQAKRQRGPTPFDRPAANSMGSRSPFCRRPRTRRQHLSPLPRHRRLPLGLPTRPKNHPSPEQPDPPEPPLLSLQQRYREWLKQLRRRPGLTHEDYGETRKRKWGEQVPFIGRSVLRWSRRIHDMLVHNNYHIT
jgi:hypothetical protein